MSLLLDIIQMPLEVAESHADHTYNIKMNDYSAYTDIRLIVDIYKNPYQNDMGPGDITGIKQDYGKAARLLVPVNQYGHCIFNIETIIRNFVKQNPRNMQLIYNPTADAEANPYLISYYLDNATFVTGETSQATIVNGKESLISFSNGFNGGFDGFDNLYQVNEYRCIFGVQYTDSVSKNTIQFIDTTNWNVYSGYTGGSINVLSAATQPYGVMIYPGVQDNKQLGITSNPNLNPYYSATNLNGLYNYQDYKVYNYAMNTGVAPLNQPGQFMATFGDETIPMTIFGGPVKQTRWRYHYYDCPIVLGVMYGDNPLYNNSSILSGITFLQKTQGNGQMNYDFAQSVPLQFTTGSTYYSFLGQRIIYGVFKQNPQVNTYSDVAVFGISGTCYTNDNEIVSEIVQYKMMEQECFNDPYSFLFMNRQGVWDTYTFTKKSTKTYKPQRKTYGSWKTLNTTTWNRQSYDAYESVYWGQSDETFIFQSNFVYQNDRQVIEELLMSPYVYMIMNNWTTPVGTEMYPYLIPVIVQNSDVQVFQQKYNRIYQYTLETKQVPYRRYDMPY